LNGSLLDFGSNSDFCCHVKEQVFESVKFGVCANLGYGMAFNHKYANEDVSLGSWLIGLDVEHVDDRRLCCGTPPGNLKFYFSVLFTFPFFSFSHHVFLFE